MISTELVLSIAGLLLAVISLYISRQDKGTEAVKDLEHRLTELESNRFTTEDRQCLQDLELKMSLFWSIVEKEFPRLLVQADTPVLDVLLMKAHRVGIATFTPTERQQLLDNLDVEYINAIEREDSGRAMAISLFRATLLYRKVQGDDNTC